VKEIFIPLLMFAAILFHTPIAGSGDGVENRGAKTILIFGGKMRDVHFPHQRHQDTLGDCDVCHDLFPKKSGSIQELKDRGILEKKLIMQKHCIDCHRKMKSAGRNTGPTSCARCHRETE
jgi:Cytochrome c7 and related cytochrome c